jgi:hypothetical protein
MRVVFASPDFPGARQSQRTANPVQARFASKRRAAPVTTHRVTFDEMCPPRENS